MLVTTGVGPVIAGANCDGTYYGDVIGAWDVGCSAPKGVTGDESVRSSRLQQIGIDYARDHLSRLPVVMGARVGRLLEVYDPDPATFGAAWVEAALLVAWYAALPLAVAGAVGLRRRRIPIFPLVATAAAVVINAALTWGTPRFRIPVDIVVVVLAAVAVDAIGRHLTGRRDRSRHHDDLALGDGVVTDAIGAQHG